MKRCTAQCHHCGGVLWKQDDLIWCEEGCCGQCGKQYVGLKEDVCSECSKEDNQLSALA